MATETPWLKTKKTSIREEKEKSELTLTGLLMERTDLGYGKVHSLFVT
jgi:hypothetical protein